MNKDARWRTDGLPNQRRLSRIVVGIVVTLLFGFPSPCQTFTGSVAGRVTDPQHAAIPNARVILKSTDMGWEKQTTTTSAGDYAFQLVAPGSFSVQAEAPGFTFAKVVAQVFTATPVRIDLVLTIGPVKQSIVVAGESAGPLQMENANLGTTITQQQIATLPSLTRNPYDLLTSMAGASPSNDGRGVGIAMNGQRTISGNFLLDGGENNDAFLSQPGVQVPLDAIQELGVQTSGYSAEYGRDAGMIANVVTKSGTNNFHGSVYDYVRNSGFAANTYENNAAGLPRPVFNRNQFGGTLGGPLRKGKLFFFVSAEPIIVRSTAATVYTVPTPDLVSISSPGTQSIFRAYPLPAESHAGVQHAEVCPYAAECDPDTMSGYVTIPAFELVSRNGPLDAGAGPPQNSFLTTGRLDWLVDSKTQFFGRYALQNLDIFAIAEQPYTQSLDQPEHIRNQNLTLNLSRAWSPNLATEGRFVYARLDDHAPLVPQPPFPSFSIGDSVATLPSGSNPFGGPQNFYEFFQSAVWTHGKHTLKFGGQLVFLRDNRAVGVHQAPEAAFLDTQGFVDGSLYVYAISIDAKGRFPGETIDPPLGPPQYVRHYRNNDAGLFIADTWRATPRLTITPGLRWEYFGVPYSPGSEQSQDSNFYLGPGSNDLQRIANGRILRTVDAPGALKGHYYLPDYKNFAPRLGIAYDLFGHGKTVFRSGIGVYYSRIDGFEVFGVAQNPPAFADTVQMNVSLTPQTLTNLYSVFPAEPFPLDQAFTRNMAEDFRPAYTVSWNATLEHELRSRFFLGLSYLGASGNRLYSKNNVDRLGSAGLLDPSCITTRYASDGITPIGPDYTDCGQLNPELAVVAVRGNLGHSSYNAFQARLDSRNLSRWGLQFGINYTWSHSIDDSSSSNGDDSISNRNAPWPLDAFNISLDRGPSDFDQTHRIAANFAWQVPLGQHSAGRFKQYLLRGWAISGLVTYQTGQPFSILDGGVPGLENEHSRPRLIGTQPSATALAADTAVPNNFLYVPLNQVYDPAGGGCLAHAVPFACGASVNGPFYNTLSRNTYRRPSTGFQNVSFFKDIALRERLTMQFRAEFYNLFNHPNLFVNAFSTDVFSNSFTGKDGSSGPGVTTSFSGERQIVLALKLIF